MHAKSFFGLLLLALLGATAASAYEFQPLGFESISMGGAGVASAKGSMAGYYNPALLTKSPYSVETNLGVGVGVEEKNLANNLDKLSNLDLSGTVDRIAASFSGTSAAAVSATDRANILTAQTVLKSFASDNGLSVAPTGSLGIQIRRLAVGAFVTSTGGGTAVLSPTNTDFIFKQSQNVSIPGVGNLAANVYFKYDPSANTYTYNIISGNTSYNLATYAIVPAAGATYDPTLNETAYQNQSIQAAIAPGSGKTYLKLDGMMLTEVPVSYAGTVKLPFLGTIGVGASVKGMQGITYSGQQAIDTNTNHFTDTLKHGDKSSTAFGVDAGLIYDLPFMHSLSLGVVGKDLNKPKFKLIDGSDYTVDPMYRAGACLAVNKSITLAADYDLKSNIGFSGQETQYFGGGFELRPSWRWLSGFSLRGGAMENLKNTSELGTIYTAGLSFGLKWAQIDLAGEMSTKKGEYQGNSIPEYARVNLSLVSRW